MLQTRPAIAIAAGCPDDFRFLIAITLSKSPPAATSRPITEMTAAPAYVPELTNETALVQIFPLVVLTQTHMPENIGNKSDAMPSIMPIRAMFFAGGRGGRGPNWNPGGGGGGG